MTFELFEEIVIDFSRRKPVLFGLEHDKACSAEQMEEFENMLQVSLSEKYKQFLMNYGGGYFGYASVYSLDKTSSFYLLAHNDTPVGDYLRIADNGCGDYFLLKVNHRKCLEQLFCYDHDAKTICATEYADILEYLLKVGLKAKFPER